MSFYRESKGAQLRDIDGGQEDAQATVPAKRVTPVAQGYALSASSTADHAPPRSVRRSNAATIALVGAAAGLLCLALGSQFIAGYPLAHYRMEGITMEPALSDGADIFVNKMAYRFHGPARGDIIVFRYPLDPSRLFVKRVIGLPGDTVAIKATIDRNHVSVNRVFLNGTLLEEPYSKDPPDTDAIMNCHDASGCSYTVPHGNLFVMGDNRNNSYDSREWGPLPESDVIGPVILALGGHHGSS